VDRKIPASAKFSLLIFAGGLRLDECTKEVQDAIHRLLRASFSPAGYEKVLGCCLTNDFLGHLVNGKRVLNEHSYNFRLFGRPDMAEPWGYTFFGHHLCLTVTIQGQRMVIGPSFMGAEPDRIDEGPHAGLRLFRTEELLSLKLMQSLSPELQARATLAKEMDGASLPADRWNPFDERHLGGARQDNRIVPFGESLYQIREKHSLRDLQKVALSLRLHPINSSASSTYSGLSTSTTLKQCSSIVSQLLKRTSTILTLLGLGSVETRIHTTIVFIPPLLSWN
jgi:hypothetical protein